AVPSPLTEVNPRLIASSQAPVPSAPAAVMSPDRSTDGNTRMVAASANAVNGNSPAPGLGAGRGVRGPLPPVQIVNTPQVSLDYEVAKAGPSGVGKVELWITQDDGRSWRFYAEDPDQKSPITIDLPGEGVYGFTLVLQSGAGLSKGAPVAGEAPEIRIELDTTPPLAQLFLPEPDPQKRDSLVITWNVSDRNLATNPITLQWTDRPGGTWQPIAADLPNTGRYSWQLPPNLPFRVYLRLLARDNAGN